MKDCVIITSIIETTSLPLSYSDIRSVYSHQQRFEQTLETIDSVRKYLPGTTIVLVECSPESEYMRCIREKVDVFINQYPNDKIRNGTHKGLCEAELMMKVFESFDLTEYRYIFKISGRYKLLDTFDINEWIVDKPVGCFTYNYSGPSIHTFFYKFTPREIDTLKNMFEQMIEMNVEECIEKCVYKALLPNIKFIEKIGIEARWSCYNFTSVF